MKFIFFSILFLIHCSSLLSGGTGFANVQHPDDLILMIENYPPYNYYSQGTLQGISVDIVELILKQLGSHQSRKDIRVMPGARLYRNLLLKPNTVSFFMAKTSERSPLFKWVGPLTTAKNVLIGKADFKYKLNKKNIKKFRIGVVRDHAGEELVRSRYQLVKNDLEFVSNGRLNIRKLARGRIDLFAFDENVAKWFLEEEGFFISDFKTVTTLEKSYHYIAFNKFVPDHVVNKWQIALNQLKAKGVVNRIINHYLSQPVQTSQVKTFLIANRLRSVSSNAF